jgi:hypothetical protein
VVILAIAFATAGAPTASGNCGHARLTPDSAPAGVAPLAIGDSVMIDAARRLARKGFEVDAKCGRSPRGGLYVLRRRRARHALPESVVLALGTNFWISSRQIRKALHILGRRRTLFLVTPYRSWRAVGNEPIRRAARRRPGRVRMIDWSSPAYGHRGWFRSDGTHLRRSGVRAYARLLKRTVWLRQRGRVISVAARRSRVTRTLSGA